MQKLIIIGNTSTAEIMYGYTKSDKRYLIEAFSVDKEYIKEKKICGIKIVDLNDLNKIYNPKDYSVIIGIGYKNLNRNREDIFKRVKKLGFKIETYIHPDAKIHNDKVIGEGSIVLPNTVVEPYSSIGQNTVVWSNCTIGHHSKLGDNCWIAAGTIIGGEATVKNNCFLGLNVTVTNKIVIDSFNIIGANTSVQKCTKENEVYLSRNGEKHRFNASDYATHCLV